MVSLSQPTWVATNAEKVHSLVPPRVCTGLMPAMLHTKSFPRQRSLEGAHHQPKPKSMVWLVSVIGQQGGGGYLHPCFPCQQHKHKGICGISQRAHSYCPGALLECASPKLYPSSQRTSPPNNSDRAGGDGRATHRLEKPITKQQRSLKLSKENNSSARAKLSFPMPATQAQRNLRDQPAVYIANPPSPIPTPPCGHRGKTRTADGVGQPPHRALTRNSGTPRTYKVRPHSQPGQDPRSEKKVHPNPPGGPAAAG